MPEGALAVGATAADNRDFLLVEVCHGIVLRSALREDLDSAALAGVGSFVRESLNLSGDESYSSHGREFLIGLLCFTQTWEKIAKGRFPERRERSERRDSPAVRRGAWLRAAGLFRRCRPRAIPPAPSRAPAR